MKIFQKKNLRLLICLLSASVLVIAVSIYATLAFLTAETNIRRNQFHSAANITGETVEPYGEEEGEFDGDSRVDYAFRPGNQYAKDPLIHNLTVESEVYVGARVDFYIAVTKEGDDLVYRQVPYDLFAEYVTVNGFNVGSGAGQWEEVAVTTARTANDNAVSAHADFSSALGTQWSKYYVYNDVLAASASRSESVAVGTGAGTYQIGATDHQAGSTSSAKTSITSPIFTGVTPSGRISVSRTLPAGSCTSVLYADGPQPGDVYRYFDFRIVIHGYGVAADSSASRAEVIVHLKEDLVLPGTADRLDVVTASASNTELKASHS